MSSKRKAGKRELKMTTAGARIARAMREVIEHIEGKRTLRTTIVYVDATSGKRKVVARSKPKMMQYRR